MATTVTNKVYKATSSKEVDVKPKTVIPAPATAVPSVLTPSSTPTTLQTAPKPKVVTTNPVVGRAKY